MLIWDLGQVYLGVWIMFLVCNNYGYVIDIVWIMVRSDDSIVFVIYMELLLWIDVNVLYLKDVVVCDVSF